MRRVGSFVLPAVCVLLWSSSVLAQGSPGQRPSAANNPCPQHSANPRPGCTSPAPNANPLVRYGYCTVEGARVPGKPTRTFYLTGVFLYDLGRLDANVSAASDPNQLPWVRDFREYLVQTYHLPPPRPFDGAVNCNGADTEAAAQAGFDQIARSGTPGFSEIVQTGWKYAPNPPIAPPAAAPAVPTPSARPTTAAAAPAVAAPPAQAAVSQPGAAAVAPPAATPPPPRAVAPQQAAATAPIAPATPQPRPAAPKPPPAEKPEKKPLYMACFAELQSSHTAYFSATFESPDANEPKAEFHKMVAKTYGPVSGQFACIRKPSASEVAQQVQRWKDSVQAKDKIIETGWKP
jgi:pyruvate/2-oxoglutarate dehydrogenase complex dihydrolipoamide acyltransferase (E2) component